MNQPVVRTVGNISTAIAQSEFGNSVQRSIQVIQGVQIFLASGMGLIPGFFKDLKGSQHLFLAFLNP